jgi:hypothetical protein
MCKKRNGILTHGWVELRSGWEKKYWKVLNKDVLGKEQFDPNGAGPPSIQKEQDPLFLLAVDPAAFLANLLRNSNTFRILEN